MLITEAVIHDGFVEQQLSFVCGATPILKLRAVRNAEGKFKVVIRDANGMALVVLDAPSYANSQDCLRAAERAAVNFIIENLERVVPDDSWTW